VGEERIATVRARVSHECFIDGCASFARISPCELRFGGIGHASAPIIHICISRAVGNGAAGRGLTLEK
jgi:hypothetical protein